MSDQSTPGSTEKLQQSVGTSADSARTPSDEPSSQIKLDGVPATNVVEQAREKALAQIDVDEALSHVEKRRQHERAMRDAGRSDQAEASQGQLGTAKAQAKDVHHESTGAFSDKDGQALTEQEKNRRLELTQQVHAQYRVSGSEFRFKDQSGKIAFKDAGERMVTASNDERVAKSIVAMAEAKGWTTIKSSGHPDFRREVWMEASLRGLQDRSFKPTEQDLKLLESRRERAMQNTVEPDAAARERKQVSERTDRRQLQDGREAAAASGVNAPARSDKAKVVEAVAGAFIDAKVQDPAKREALKAAIGARTNERETANNVPSVAVFDKEAPKSKSTGRAVPSVEVNAEHTR